MYFRTRQRKSNLKKDGQSIKNTQRENGILEVKGGWEVINTGQILQCQILQER